MLISTITNAKLRGLAYLTLATPVVVGCSIFGGTVLDADKAEAEIAKYLDGRYANTGIKVDSVACGGAPKKPKPGDKFTCNARVREATVPVEVTVKDEDMRIEFVETKKLYDLPKVGPSIQAEVSFGLEGHGGAGQPLSGWPVAGQSRDTA